MNIFEAFDKIDKQKIKNELRVICTKGIVPIICKPEKRSRGIFPKWWCYNCKRYVLPDGKYHLTHLWAITSGDEASRKNNRGGYEKPKS